MVHSKKMCFVVLFLLGVLPIKVLAQNDSLFNVSGFKLHFALVKKFIVQNNIRRVYANYGGSSQSAFNGDTAAIYQLDRGVRFGAEYDASLSKIKRLKRFSTTIG